jgi:DUF2075 family protein
MEIRIDKWDQDGHCLVKELPLIVDFSRSIEQLECSFHTNSVFVDGVKYLQDCLERGIKAIYIYSIDPDTGSSHFSLVWEGE